MKIIIIITGASSGIGREFARQIIYKRTFDELWLVARRQDRLEEVSAEIETTLKESLSDTKQKVRFFSADITGTDGMDFFSRLFQQETKDSGEFVIDTLINNAGFGTYGPFAETPLNRELEMINLNCTSLTGICGTALPYLAKGSSIINVSSLAAFSPLGNFAVYAATKAYVYSFSLALAAELADKGIHVMALCPGSVSTEFALVASNGARQEVKGGKSVVKLVAHALRCQKKGKKVALMALKWKVSAFLSHFVGKYFYARYTYLHEKRPYRQDR